MSRIDILQKRVVDLDKSIASIEQGGQEIQYNGRKIRKADLNILYSQRRETQNELDMLTGGNGGRIGVAIWTNR